MIRRFFLIALVILSMYNVSSQTYIFDVPYSSSSILPLVPSDSLFKKEIISNKKIKKAYLLKTWGLRDIDGNAEFKDTLTRFDFDSTGAVFQKVVYSTSLGKKTTRLINVKDGEAEYPYDSLAVSKIPFGSGWQLTKTFFWRNKQHKLEKAIEVYERTDGQGRVIEQKHTPTCIYTEAIDCGMGQPPFHFKYTYDSLDRITKTESAISTYHTKYEYLDFGIRISQSLPGNSYLTEIVSIFHNEYQTIYNFEDKQVIVLPDSLSDQLVWLIAIRETQYYSQPTFYEFAYEQ